MYLCTGIWDSLKEAAMGVQNGIQRRVTGVRRQRGYSALHQAELEYQRALDLSLAADPDANVIGDGDIPVDLIRTPGVPARHAINASPAAPTAGAMDDDEALALRHALLESLSEARERGEHVDMDGVAAALLMQQSFAPQTAHGAQSPFSTTEQGGGYVDGGDDDDGDEVSNALRLARAEAASKALRDEQAAAFERTMAADVQRAAEAEALEQAQRRSAEEAEARERARVDRLRRVREGLVEEPGPGDAGVSALVVRLVDGHRVSRRWAGNTPLARVHEWIQCQELDVGPDAVPQGFVMVADYPRREFHDLQQTLRDAGLCPRALITIEEPGLMSEDEEGGEEW